LKEDTGLGNATRITDIGNTQRISIGKSSREERHFENKAHTNIKTDLGE
jgi:hypothetical protein